MTTYRSKWGFHPCDIETFRLLQRLNHYCMKARIEMGSWKRTLRKMPHNRTIIEPRLSPLINATYTINNDRSCGELRHLSWKWSSLNNYDFETLYRNAKEPKKEEKDVIPFPSRMGYDPKIWLVFVLKKLDSHYGESPTDAGR